MAAMGLAAALAAATGCAARVDRRTEPHASRGVSGAPAALVFHDPHRPADPGTPDDLARNDAALSPNPVHARLVSDDWPEQERASLEYYRRIQFPDRAGTLMYFQRPSEFGAYPGYGSDHYHRPVHPWRRLPGDLPPWW